VMYQSFDDSFYEINYLVMNDRAVVDLDQFANQSSPNRRQERKGAGGWSSVTDDCPGPNFAP
jgi:hypothetical protein